MQPVARWLGDLVNPGPPVQQTGNTNQRELTKSGTSVCSAISPDGKWVAHAEEQNGKQYLAVTNTTTFHPSLAVAADAVQYLGVAFSRDDNYLYFTRKEPTGPGILYRLAWPGGNPTKVKTGVDSPISFSPQGERFAFVRHDEATHTFSLILSNIDGTNEHVIASRKHPERLSVHGAAWSPDGNMVVCGASYWDKGFHMNLVGFDVRNGHEQLIGDRAWFRILQVAWQDMTSLVISASDRETTSHQLWRIRFPDGAAHRITTNLDDYTGVSLSGKNIVTVRTSVRWDLWVTSLDESQKSTMIEPGGGMNYGLTWTSKGKIVFTSLFRDQLHIFRIDPDGSNRVQLTSDGDNYTPAASADGRYIVFASNRNGPFNIWRTNTEDGSDLLQLTFNDGNYYPSVSPDNQWVAYDDVINSGISVWKVPLSGGAPVKVSERYRMPASAPKKKFIACRYNLESGTRDVAIFSAQGGPPLRRFAVEIQEWQRVQWLPNGRELSYVRNENGYSNIWSYNVDTDTSKRLTNFDSNQIYAYAWSPDYKQLASQRGTRSSNVTIITEP